MSLGSGELKPSSGFPTRSYTNRVLQPQGMFRGLNLNLNLNSLLVKRQSDNPSPEKFLTRKEGLYYISMERKNSTDQIYTFVLCMHQSKFYHDMAHMSFRLYQGGKNAKTL